MFGLAAFAAVAAMAFLGASSAMASSTALCKVDTSPCPAGQLVSHVHFVDPAAQLLNPIQNVTCEALFLGDVQNATLLGAPVEILGNFTYTNCSGGCEAKEVSKKAEVNVLKTGTELGEVVGEGEVLVKCALILHCIYNGVNLVGHGLGGLATTAAEKGHVTFSKTPVERVGGQSLLLCPSSATLDALFESLEKQYLTA
jgi:hypothetical protein